MHSSALLNLDKFFSIYLKNFDNPKILDFGSQSLSDHIGSKVLLDKMNIKGYSIQKGNIYFIKEIAAKLMVSSIKWNYDPPSAKKGSHSLSISDFY